MRVSFSGFRVVPADTSCVAQGDTEVRYVSEDGDPVVSSLGEVAADRVVVGRPVRRVRSYSGQRHYAGLYWSSTTRAHTVYESRLELQRLMLADFAPDVDWIAAQPMWLAGPDAGIVRKHVPDLLLRLRGGRFLVVDVKPAQFAARPEVAAVFAWTQRLCSARGWAYEVWTGEAPVVMKNVEFLAHGRRPEFIDAEALEVVRGVVTDGMTVGQIESESARRGAAVTALRPALLAMLWAGEWSVDLREPLSRGSTVHRGARKS